MDDTPSPREEFLVAVNADTVVYQHNDHNQQAESVSKDSLMMHHEGSSL